MHFYIFLATLILPFLGNVSSVVAVGSGKAPSSASISDLGREDTSTHTTSTISLVRADPSSFFFGTQDPTNPAQQWQVAYFLWHHDHVDLEKTREIFCPILLRHARDPRGDYYESAVASLNNWNGTWSSEDYAELQPNLLYIARNAAHPLQWWVLKRLWGPQERNASRDRLLLSSTLFEIAQNTEHEQRWSAIWSLWDWESPLQLGYQEILRTTLLNAAEDVSHPQHMNSLWGLWDGSEEYQQTDRALLYPRFLQIAEDATHPQRWDVIESLWQWNSAHQEEDRARFRLLLRERALRHENSICRAQAFRCLAQSNDPRDQRFVQKFQQMSEDS